ncbi:hypothetical protein [Aeromicrobium sp. UC242_57]|uniref:hypothetical protein n=1 Tax=Aeromicrobium sp. UC242_57 TaxID=3374624 RepID=UPI0037A3A3A4
MTQTIEPPSTTTQAATVTAQQRVDRWLAAFEDALANRDIAAAAGLFAVDSYWRDLVSFTWNLVTVEGRDGISGMLTERLADTDPSGFTTSEPPTESDGVTEAWIEFETATGRAKGHLRLQGDEGWTLLTSLRELKGHEESFGERRPQGVSHGCRRDGRPGRRSARPKPLSSVTARSPMS